MITSKADYLYYLECDRVALKEKRKSPSILPGAEVWKYQRLLRKTEYYTNCKKRNPLRFYFKWRLHDLSVKYGFSIPLNAFGPGLSIAHIGTIVINSKSKVGANCRVQTGVTLGATNGSVEAPQLGDNVFLGDGCKLIGGITIADDVAIGANAVVVKSITEPGTTWGGVPAKKISNNSSASNLVKATEILNGQCVQHTDKSEKMSLGGDNKRYSIMRRNCDLLASRSIMQVKEQRYEKRKAVC